ncbi:hypothetical protein P0W64_09325 [Tsukamurella sp. 8F]|uniref:hypothetical protein n=1 Tax=unclassified Tsukamurella TaxID=2633480 RepID=UPI0023B8952A|nr:MULTISPECIES: hypothetical protein [unclassified Tsukamurella]MDF0529780.1 hypothetical protein [Tsukamurella sp. 8J]MDF0586972.1 hypothetical protein [Tsukamurella sp. 8F]
MDIRDLNFKPDPADLLIVALGGTTANVAEYENGRATGNFVTRNGGTVRRVAGVSVALAGRGLDGVTVETSTAIDALAPGTVLKPAGEIEFTVRPTARAGFNGRPPSASLRVTAYFERLVPVGSVGSVVKRGGGSDA